MLPTAFFRRLRAGARFAANASLFACLFSLPLSVDATLFFWDAPTGPLFLLPFSFFSFRLSDAFLLATLFCVGLFVAAGGLPGGLFKKDALKKPAAFWGAGRAGFFSRFFSSVDPLFFAASAGVVFLVCGFFASAFFSGQLPALLFAWRLFAAAGFAAAFVSSALSARVAAVGFAAAGLLVAAVGILQTAAGGPLGLSFLGEPAFSAEAFNVPRVPLSEGEVFVRPPATTPHAVVAAAFAGLSLPFVFWLSGFPLFLIVSFLVAALFLFGARAALFGAAAGLLLWVWPRLSGRQLFAAAAGAGGGVAAAALLGAPFWARIASIPEGLALRVAALSDFLPLFSFVGLGGGGATPAFFAAYASPLFAAQPPHNAFALAFLEGGLLGGFGFLLLLGAAVLASGRAPAAGAGLFVLFFVSLFDHAPLTHPGLLVGLFALFGIIFQSRFSTLFGQRLR